MLVEGDCGDDRYPILENYTLNARASARSSRISRELRTVAEERAHQDHTRTSIQASQPIISWECSSFQGGPVIGDPEIAVLALAPDDAYS